MAVVICIVVFALVLISAYRTARRKKALQAQILSGRSIVTPYVPGQPTITRDQAFDALFNAAGNPVGQPEVHEYTQKGVHVSVSTSVSSGGPLPAAYADILRQVGSAENVLNMPGVQDAMRRAMSAAYAQPATPPVSSGDWNTPTQQPVQQPTPEINPEQQADLYEAHANTESPRRPAASPFTPEQDPFAPRPGPFDRTDSPFPPRNG